MPSGQGLRSSLVFGFLVCACATSQPAEPPKAATQEAVAPAPAPVATPAPAEAAPVAAAEPAVAPPPPAPHWGYQGEVGPEHWGDQSPAYQDCKLGKHQSPIDIRFHGSAASGAGLPPLEFNYQPSPLHIINNGHTIQVNVSPGSFLTVAGKRYELVQFHFHHPSENRLNGKAFPMEAHLVHKDGDGKLAVVAVLLAQGKASPFIASLWRHIPQQEGQESAPAGATVDPSGLLPAKHAYLTFSGSLTTPPCSEDVTWMVFKTAVSISKAEVATFSALYPHNARPVQPLNDRTVQATK